MEFVFDPEKEQSNIRKHGLDFAVARAIFDDPLGATIFDRNENGENRYWHFGTVSGSFRIIMVIYTHPDPENEDLIRIISIRAATKLERIRYETNLE